MIRCISFDFLTILLGICLLAGCTKDNGGNPELPPADLSADATANCYIIPSAGSYSFKTVRGNSTKSVGDVAAAAVLWESFGTDVKPNVGDIVKSVEYKDGYVTFTTADPLNNGNALIAVMDAEDNILWSWHIWVCKDYTPTKDNQHVYNNNAGVVMDRNLGATSATLGDIHALGLLYQWGRKDPFLSAGNLPASTDDIIGEEENIYGKDATSNSYSVAASTLDWPRPVVTTDLTGKIDYAVKHPTTYIANGIDRDDWTRETPENRWYSNKKREYDPCPAGWRVPVDKEDIIDYSTIWNLAFGSGAWNTPSNWDKANLGMDFAKTDKKLGKNNSIWYPAAGGRNYRTGELIYVGGFCFCWTAHAMSDKSNASLLCFRNNGYVYPGEEAPRSWAASVRCVAE